MKHIKRKSAESEVQYGPRLAGEILHDYIANSDDDLAVAFRNQSTASEEAQDDSLFRGLFPDTHLCVDLKIISRRRGRMPVGAYINCMLTRDDEDHFTAVQSATGLRAAAEQRNPCVYLGCRINVHRKADGSLYPTFNHPHFTGDFTFRDFCREAAEELLAVAGLLGGEAK